MLNCGGNSMRHIEQEFQKIHHFEQVCMICSRDLQRFIYTMTRKDWFAMEEIYQNTMLGALKGLHYLQDCSKMKSWIFSIAKAESKRYYATASPKSSRDCGFEAENTASLEYMIDFTKSVEDREYIKDLINALSDDEQQLYILHYYYDLQLKEISKMLNVNYNTIRSMHVRGMAKMRKQHLNQLT